jgi:predicted lipoprotein
MNKKTIICIALAAVLVVFLVLSAKVIDKGTEGQYTGEVAFDANASSSGDWESVVNEITGKAQDIAALDVAAIGPGTAVSIKGTVSEFVSKAGGKKNSITVVPEGYSGDAVFTVQLGSIYSGTAVRDAQTVKAFADFTNQTEWSAYAKALNNEMHEKVIVPLGIDEGIKGKTVTIIGTATGSGKDINVTPVAITIE